MLFTRTKPVSHTARILQHLKKVGPHGAFSYDLARPNLGGLSWHRRITDLRKEGHHISTVRVSRSIFKYYLEPEDK